MAVHVGVVLPLLLLRAVLTACDASRCSLVAPLAVRPTFDACRNVLRAA